MKETCPNHPDSNPKLVPGVGIHAAGLRCSVCDLFMGWLKKSDDRIKNIIFFPQQPPPLPLIGLFDPSTPPTKPSK